MAGNPDRLDRLHLEALRVRGHKGGLIPPHRAMVGLPWTAWRLVTTLVLTVGGLAGFLAALPWLGQAWELLFVAVRDFLGITATIGEDLLTLPGGFQFTIPRVVA